MSKEGGVVVVGVLSVPPKTAAVIFLALTRSGQSRCGIVQRQRVLIRGTDITQVPVCLNAVNAGKTRPSRRVASRASRRSARLATAATQISDVITPPTGNECSGGNNGRGCDATFNPGANVDLFLVFRRLIGDRPRRR